MSSDHEQLDLGAALMARDEAILRVEEHADPDLFDRALDAVFHCATQQPHLTTDDVWVVLNETPREPRVFGAVMRRAASAGWVVATAAYRQSHRRICHARPLRVWRSLVYSGAALK